MKFTKQNKRLPKLLAHSEINKIIECTTNPKHKIMLVLSYRAVLRVSEIVKLKIKDIDFENNFIHTKQTKGKKIK